MDEAAPLADSPVAPNSPSELIAEVGTFTPETRRLAYRIVRARNSRARLIYGRPRIEASYAAPDRAAESAGDSVPLRELRLRAGLSIPALSRRSGVSVSTIRRVEHNTTIPRPHIIRALSAALGVAPWQVTEFLPVLVRVGLPEPTVLAS